MASQLGIQTLETAMNLCLVTFTLCSAIHISFTDSYMLMLEILVAK